LEHQYEGRAPSAKKKRKKHMWLLKQELLNWTSGADISNGLPCRITHIGGLSTFSPVLGYISSVAAATV